MNKALKDKIDFDIGKFPSIVSVTYKMETIETFNKTWTFKRMAQF